MLVIVQSVVHESYLRLTTDEAIILGQPVHDNPYTAPSSDT